jgi:hypothetical protein
MDFPVLGLHSGWHGDGDEGAARAHQFGRSLEDVAADDVEHHVHLADVLQMVGVQVEEGLRAEAERDITVVGSAGADHAGAHLSRELDGDRAGAAPGAVNEDGLAGREVGVVEQSLSCGQSGNGQRGGHGVVDVGREGARLRASSAVYWTRDPLRVQSVSPNTRWPTVRRWFRSRARPRLRTARARGCWVSGRGRGDRTTFPASRALWGVKPAACTRTMTSFSAARG